MGIFDLLAYRPAAIFLSLISLPFPYASLSFPSCLARIILNPLLSFRGRNYSKTIPVVLPTNSAAYRPNRPALHFLPIDLIGSRSTGGHLEISSIKNQHTARVFSRFLAYFPEANLSSTSLPSKTFHQQPRNIQRLFRLQNCLSRKSSTIFRKYSMTFWAIINSNQQQQSTTIINSSNQQHQSTAATSSSNQQQQPAAAINSSNQQHLHNPRRLPLVITTVPSRGYVLLEVDLGLAARVQPPHRGPFLLLFNFSKLPFLRFFPFC